MVCTHLSISISFSSSCFWRAMTFSMMARSSWVRWLRSGMAGGMRGPVSSCVSAISSTLRLGKWKTGDILAGVPFTPGSSSSTHSSSRGASTATLCRTRVEERVARLEAHPSNRRTWSQQSVRLGYCEARLRHCMPGIGIAQAEANVWVSIVGARQGFGAGHLGHRRPSGCLVESSSSHAPIHVARLSQRGFMNKLRK